MVKRFDQKSPEVATAQIADKLLRLNWFLIFLLSLAGVTGFLMLYSVAGESLDPWARAQIARFALGVGVMILVAILDLRIWLKLAPVLYLGALALLIAVEFFGATAGGATRWLRIGGAQFQPSEAMKVALIVALAAYFHALEPARRSHPVWLFGAFVIIAVPLILTLRQPDLGTAFLLFVGAVVVVFLAGVDWRLFVGGAVFVALGVTVIFMSRGESWQLLRDYQYKRIDSFFDPNTDTLGASYHAIQSKIAIGSGGWSGKGLGQGSQTHLSFLPEPHTDFIFTSLGEAFGLRGGLALLGLLLLICWVAGRSALRIRSDFGRLVAAGLIAAFFMLFSLNMAMVMGLAPVVGAPLPLVSYGGTALLVTLFSFGLILSADIHAQDSLL